MGLKEFLCDIFNTEKHYEYTRNTVKFNDYDKIPRLTKNYSQVPR